jgi:multimeric flavodoxin WrbA
MHTVANKIYESDIIIFFGSIRWGKMNAIYSNLMERLTWLEARHSSLGESNLLRDKEAGIIAMGHNWNVQSAVELEKDVLRFYGFKVPKELSFYRQWTSDSSDESLSGYRKDYFDFMKEFEVVKSIKEGLRNFSKWIS